LLSDELDAAPQFCAGFLPGPLSDFASDSAVRMQCPVDIIAIPLIIGAATVIGKRWRLAPKSLDDWTERACLWGGVILPSGQMKTPAMQRALRPIRLLETEFSTQHEKEMEAYRREQERALYHDRCWQEGRKQASKDGKEMPEKPKEAEQRPPPRLRRLTTSDVTQEMLVDLIDQNPRAWRCFATSCRAGLPASISIGRGPIGNSTSNAIPAQRIRRIVESGPPWSETCTSIFAVGFSPTSCVLS
jgi:hypothetical protein